MIKKIECIRIICSAYDIGLPHSKNLLERFAYELEFDSNKLSFFEFSQVLRSIASYLKINQSGDITNTMNDFIYFEIEEH